MSVIVLIPAAGMGRRMGAAVNKQYLVVDEKPILAHTLSLFDGHPAVDRILVISPSEEVAYCREEVVARYGFAKVAAVVAGGSTRQESVRKGLDACGGSAGDLVVVHDGVRPFFPAARLDAVLDAAAQVGACVAGMPAKDTIKEVVDGLIQGTPPRERLWQAQTPQAFRWSVLTQAHAAALRAGYIGTDDASLVERLGLPVAMVEGSYRNIKITTPEDLVLARAFLQHKEETA